MRTRESRERTRSIMPGPEARARGLRPEGAAFRARVPTGDSDCRGNAIVAPTPTEADAALDDEWAANELFPGRPPPPDGDDVRMRAEEERIAAAEVVRQQSRLTKVLASGALATPAAAASRTVSSTPRFVTSNLAQAAGISAPAAVDGTKDTRLVLIPVMDGFGEVHGYYHAGAVASHVESVYGYSSSAVSGQRGSAKKVPGIYYVVAHGRRARFVITDQYKLALHGEHGLQRAVPAVELEKQSGWENALNRLRDLAREWRTAAIMGGALVPVVGVAESATGAYSGAATPTVTALNFDEDEDAGDLHAEDLDQHSQFFDDGSEVTAPHFGANSDDGEV